MDPRPSFDALFMDLCRLMAGRTSCPRRGVGAVIVKEKHVLTTGYNGAPKGFPHPIETGCLREQLNVPPGQLQDICPCLHAEQNAILQAALFGVSVNGATLYSTTQPCTQCSRMIINAGIVEVVFEDTYEDPLSIGLLSTGGVQLFAWDRAGARRTPIDGVAPWEGAQAQFAESYRATHPTVTR